MFKKVISWEFEQYECLLTGWTNPQKEQLALKFKISLSSMHAFRIEQTTSISQFCSKDGFIYFIFFIYCAPWSHQYCSSKVKNVSWIEIHLFEILIVSISQSQLVPVSFPPYIQWSITAQVISLSLQQVSIQIHNHPPSTKSHSSHCKKINVDWNF